MFEIYQFTCRSDNFGVLVHDPKYNLTASIDAPDFETVEAALHEKGWQLTHIFTTHHHFDHVAGHKALKEKYGCLVIGPEKEKDKIPCINQTVQDGDHLSFGSVAFKVMETPGHTLGHVIYYCPEVGVLFAGDTLFPLGCGRLFEGSALDMWQSLQKILALPGDTKIYCGHEYTSSNADFAMVIDPENEVLKKRFEEVKAFRDADKPTVPTILKQELLTNPFLRVGDYNIRQKLGMLEASDEEVFIEIRRLKDNF